MAISIYDVIKVIRNEAQANIDTITKSILMRRKTFYEEQAHHGYKLAAKLEKIADDDTISYEEAKIQIESAFKETKQELKNMFVDLIFNSKNKFKNDEGNVYFPPTKLHDRATTIAELDNGTGGTTMYRTVFQQAQKIAITPPEALLLDKEEIKHENINFNS